MLIQFSVSNFMSMRDEVILSMIAGKGSEHSESLIKSGKDRFLSDAVIYGANAAGKSNIFKAITAALIIVRSSNTRQINEPMPLLVPFKFDDVSSSMPSTFGFIFTSKGIKYEYGFTVDAGKVYKEYLYEYKSAKASKVFERTDTAVYSFTKADEKEFREYAKKTADNKLFLATATAWNCERTKDAYMWLAEGIDTYDPRSMENAAMPLIDNDKDGTMELFQTRLLQKADINISGYDFKATTMSDEKLSKIPVPPGVDLAKVLADKTGAFKQCEITTKHDIETESGIKNFVLPFEAESEGTRKLFYFGPAIKEAIEKGKTVIVDEIDDSLHPLLVSAIIEMFNDKDVNKHGAQLIFNTHDVSLLSLDNFRRDQIYFVEKDNKTGVTDLYSLDEFSPRKTENIRKGYLQGRYGAIPVIGPGGLG